VLSVHVGDGVEDAYEDQRRAYEIVHPLTQEPWGVRRFFVRDPDGNVINVVSHSDHWTRTGVLSRGPVFVPAVSFGQGALRGCSVDSSART